MSFLKRRDEVAPSPLQLAAEGKVASAGRLTAAVREAGEALEELRRADRDFWRARQAACGDVGVGTSRLLSQLGVIVLGDLEATAPDILSLLRLPRRPPNQAETAESFVSRQVKRDLEEVGHLKEEAK